MSNFVAPNVYLIGFSSLYRPGLDAYLRDTNQTEFAAAVLEAEGRGLSDSEILCSFYAKLCYASLVPGKNDNITKVRSIWDNLLATIESGHGSIFEHCTLNFVIHDCSRVLTHELVRHRAGAAYSQTSGRYVRTDSIGFVSDPILQPAATEIGQLLRQIEEGYRRIQEKMGITNDVDFALKKKITSAMRRILPNGQANEIGFSLNLRALRHVIESRTSRHAEREIRSVFNQVYALVRPNYPAIFSDVLLTSVDGLDEITFRNKKL
jgi:thymidylate synthase (FAD)